MTARTSTTEDRSRGETLTGGLESSSLLISSTVAGDSSTWIDDGQYDMHIRRVKNSMSFWK